MGADERDAAPEAYRAALRGDLAGLVQAWATLTDAGWRLAGQALVALGQPERAPMPTLDAVTAALPSRGAVEALGSMGRAGLLALDLDAVAGCEARLAGVGTAAASRLQRLLLGQRSALTGDAARASGLAAELQEEARAGEHAVALVEAAILSAFAAMAAGDLTSAIQRARLASRMAQAERLWLSHFTASVILARLRRLGGRPHLAGLIAGACRQAAPPAFDGWCAWEQLFAGVAPEPARRADRLGRAVDAAARMLTTGSLDHAAAVTAALAVSAPHASDWAAAVAATSSRAPVAVDAATAAWLEGDVDEPPPALMGLVAPEWSEDATPVAVGAPGARGRRVLAAPEGYARLTPLGARPARPEAVAAAIVLAGPEGLSREAWFERAYGFAYRPRLHEASFKVVRHQARKLLGEHATVLSEGETRRLEARAAFAVPDPRTRRPLSDVVLRTLASAGECSAREVAERLGVPLRTVQMALRQMTEEGACVAHKDGRRIAYAVEDTTFCALTRA